MSLFLGPAAMRQVAAWAGRPVREGRRPLQAKAYYINLDASAERRRHMEAGLVRAGLAYERVAGIRGSALPPDLMPYFCGPDGRIASAMTPGEVGCHAAHLAASRRFLADNAADPALVALVLEDDVQLPGRFAELLDATLSQLPPGWDIVRLSNTPKRAWVPVARAGEHHVIVQYSKVPILSGAYLVSRDGARKLLTPGLRRHAIDKYLQRPWLAGLATYGVFPAPVGLKDFASDIDAEQQRHRNGRSVRDRARRLDLRHLPMRLKFEIGCFGFRRWLILFALNAADKLPGRQLTRPRSWCLSYDNSRETNPPPPSASAG